MRCVVTSAANVQCQQAHRKQISRSLGASKPLVVRRVVYHIMQSRTVKVPLALLRVSRTIGGRPDGLRFERLTTRSAAQDAHADQRSRPDEAESKGIPTPPVCVQTWEDSWMSDISPDASCMCDTLNLTSVCHHIRALYIVGSCYIIWHRSALTISNTPKRSLYTTILFQPPSYSYQRSIKYALVSQRCTAMPWTTPPCFEVGDIGGGRMQYLNSWVYELHLLPTNS